MTPEPRIPEPEGLHREFYERTLAAGRLVFQHCGDCGRARHQAALP